MSNEGRSATVIGVIGMNNCGKTSAARKLIDAEINKGGHVIVVVPDYAEWLEHKWIDIKTEKKFKGIRKVLFEETTYKNKAIDFAGTFIDIAENFRDGVVVLEDCRAYLDSRIEKDLKRLMIRRRQKMFDIIYMAHGFTEVPPKLLTFTTHYVLFKTLDNIQNCKSNIRNYDIVKEVYDRVNDRGNADIHYNEVIKM